MSCNEEETCQKNGICSTQNDTNNTAEGKLPSIEDFVFLKPISRGAFGKVYLGCKKTAPDKVYAIKAMKKSDLFNKNLVKQVTTERDALATSHSPFVVNLYYSLQSEQNIYLIMEYMIGGDVKSLLTMYGYFDEDMAKMYIAEVTLALEYLNDNGIIHRDLKPDNMLISNEGHIKLTDFGLSKISIDVGAACNNSLKPASSSVNYHRTPGQILSLKSSLAFNVTASMRKRKLSAQSPLVSGRRSRNSFNSPLKEAIFNSPLLKKSHEISPLLPPVTRNLNPANAKHSTPPIQCLTPTLEDSLNWTSTDSDSSYVTAHSSSLSRPISSLAMNADQSASFTISDRKKSITKPEKRDSRFDSGAEVTTVKIQAPSSNQQTIQSTASSSQDSSMDETPQLRLSNESVWNSYAARNLRSMREGSYSEEDSGEENSKTSESPLFRPQSGKYNIKKKSRSTSVLSDGYASSSGKSSLYGYHSDDEMDFSSKFSATRRKRGYESLSEASLKVPLKSGLTADFGVLKMMGDDPCAKRQRLDPSFEDSRNQSHNSEMYAADISCDNSMSDGILRCRECNNTSSEDLSSLETSVDSFHSSRVRHLSDMSNRTSGGGNSTVFLTPADENMDPKCFVDGLPISGLPQKQFRFNTDLFKSPLPQSSSLRTKVLCNCQSTEQNNTSQDNGTGNPDILMMTPDQSIKRQMGSFLTPRTPAEMKKTPFKTPHKNIMKTPFRTPKSVRRGPKDEEEERILGTPDYLAPEILMQKPHGAGVDWWALGVCLFEFLTGIPPFNDQTPELVFQNILKRDIPWPEEEEELSEQAKSAIDELLTMDPAQRPQAQGVKNMALFADVDWEHVLETEPAFIPQPDDELDTTYFDARNKVQQLIVSAVDL